MLITKIFNNTISSFLSIWQIEKEQTIFLEKRNKQFDIYTKKKKDTFIRTKGEDSSAYTWASWTAVRPRNRSPILTHSSTPTKATTNGGDQNTVELQNRDRKPAFLPGRRRGDRDPIAIEVSTGRIEEGSVSPSSRGGFVRWGTDRPYPRALLARMAGAH